MASTHYISNQAFERLLNRAQMVAEHGKRFQKIAALFSEKRVCTREQAECINQIGQQIQSQAQSTADLIKQSLQDEQPSPEEYVFFQQQHCQTVLLYTKAIRLMVQALQSLLTPKDV